VGRIHEHSIPENLERRNCHSQPIETKAKALFQGLAHCIPASGTESKINDLAEIINSYNVLHLVTLWLFDNPCLFELETAQGHAWMNTRSPADHNDLSTLGTRPSWLENR
jgi:hypothetical protein